MTGVNGPTGAPVRSDCDAPRGRTSRQDASEAGGIDAVCVRARGDDDPRRAARSRRRRRLPGHGRTPPHEASLRFGGVPGAPVSLDRQHIGRSVGRTGGRESRPGAMDVESLAKAGGTVGKLGLIIVQAYKVWNDKKVKFSGDELKLLEKVKEQHTTHLAGTEGRDPEELQQPEPELEEGTPPEPHQGKAKDAKGKKGKKATFCCVSRPT
eukprot:COSAG01_NODE_8839_length_2641_cov_1.638080_1_plen_210_part_00